MRKFLSAAFFVWILLFFGVQFSHHHSDFLIHQDCTVCHGVQILSDGFFLGSLSGIVVIFVFLWLSFFPKLFFESLDDQYAVARAPPFSFKFI